MANVLLLLAGYLLGIGSVVIFGALMVLHRPKYEAPTLHRRRYRDRPVPEAKLARDATDWDVAQEEASVRYEFLGITGEER